MNIKNPAFFLEIKKPWVLWTHNEITQDLISKDIHLLEVDATLMMNLEGLYREFATAFKFPNYFGKNFNALDECINDLDWLPANGYLLVIKNSGDLLNEESDDTLASLLKILDNAGREWANPVAEGEPWDREGVPFHTILELEENEISGFKLRLKKLSFELKSL